MAQTDLYTNLAFAARYLVMSTQYIINVVFFRIRNEYPGIVVLCIIACREILELASITLNITAIFGFVGY